MKVHQHEIQWYHAPRNKQYFIDHLRPNEYHIFSISLSRTSDWKDWLKSVSLFDKIVYQGPNFYTKAHQERAAPSSFIIICKS
jgi:hypothetical protein